MQIRDVKALRGDDANMLAIWRGEEVKTAKDKEKKQEARTSTEVDLLSRVRR